MTNMAALLPVCPAKTQINLGIRPVRSEFLVSAWRNIGPLTTYWAHSEDSDQTGRIWVFAGRTCHFVVFFVQRLIYAKNLKNHLLWNQKADDHESLFAASYTGVLLNLFKWPILRQGQNWVPFSFVWDKVKTLDFSEISVVYDIKISRCSQLNEYTKLYEYQRSRSFIDLGPNLSDSIFLNFFSSITTDFNISSALRWAIQDQWSSRLLNEMKWATSWQILSLGVCDQVRHKLACTATEAWNFGYRNKRHYTI